MTAHGCFGKPRSDHFWFRQRRLLARPGEVSWQVAQRRPVEADQQVTQNATDRSGGWCAYSTPQREADVRGCTRNCRDPAPSGTYGTVYLPMDK